MKKLSANQQKFLKSIHIITACLWFSCVILLLLLPLIAKYITNGDELYMYNLIYHFIDMFVLTPAAILTFFTAIIYSVFTKWGFFKHGWIIYKWIITLFIILVGTFYLGPLVEDLLALADTKRALALLDSYYLQGSLIGIWAAIINTLLISIALVFSIYKPWKNIKKPNKELNIE